MIGCMTPLHNMELHEGLNTYTNGAIKESLRGIVGGTVRNCATVEVSGDDISAYPDVLTLFLALDTEVELF
ncbi:MAG: hypothetical protein V8Q57_09450 [Blautia sp.]